MKIFYFVLILLVISSCSDKDAIELFAECDFIKDEQILSKEEAEMACIRNDVYSFRGNLYTVCSCCLCNKVPSIQDCNGEQLCTDFNADCTNEFFEKAEYQFSLKSE